MAVRQGKPVAVKVVAGEAGVPVDVDIVGLAKFNVGVVLQFLIDQSQHIRCVLVAFVIEDKAELPVCIHVGLFFKGNQITFGVFFVIIEEIPQAAVFLAVELVVAGLVVEQEFIDPAPETAVEQILFLVVLGIAVVHTAVALPSDEGQIVGADADTFEGVHFPGVLDHQRIVDRKPGRSFVIRSGDLIDDCLVESLPRILRLV